MNELAQREPQTWGLKEIMQAAQVIAKSRLFGMQTPEQAAALMMLAQAEGLHPMIAARDYHIIKGRPSLKADAMLARFQAAGGHVKWLIYTAEEVRAEFTHPSAGTVIISWTMAQAKAAGLAGKDNWRMYPRAMLRARVISEGVRTVFPGVVVGVYTPEEVSDFDTPQIEIVDSEVSTPSVAENTTSSVTTSSVEAAGGQVSFTDANAPQSDAQAPAEGVKLSTWDEQVFLPAMSFNWYVSRQHVIDVLKARWLTLKGVSYEEQLSYLETHAYDSTKHGPDEVDLAAGQDGTVRVEEGMAEQTMQDGNLGIYDTPRS